MSFYKNKIFPSVLCDLNAWEIYFLQFPEFSQLLSGLDEWWKRARWSEVISSITERSGRPSSPLRGDQGLSRTGRDQSLSVLCSEVWETKLYQKTECTYGGQTPLIKTLSIRDQPLLLLYRVCQRPREIFHVKNTKFGHFAWNISRFSDGLYILGERPVSR